MMAQKRHTVEQIIHKLREAEVALSKGEVRSKVVRRLGITEQTDYRRRKEYGGLRTDQARRFKELEKENAHLQAAGCVGNGCRHARDGHDPRRDRHGHADRGIESHVARTCRCECRLTEENRMNSSRIAVAGLA